MTLADTFKQRIEELAKQDAESRQQTQATLQRIRALITDLKAIDLDD
jgi:signal transduction histidine kinase